MFRSKWETTFVLFMLMLFLTGLFLALYPYIQGAVVDRRMNWEADSFLNRVAGDPEDDMPNIVILPTVPEAEETRQYPELWDAMTAYNQRIFAEGQSALASSGAYQVSTFTLVDHGLPDETFGVISIPKLELEMPLYLGATDENMAKRVFDEATGKGKTSIRFEKAEAKPNGKLRQNPLSRPVQEITHAAHNEVRKVEQENVGVEAGHKAEEMAEHGVLYAGSKVRQAVFHHQTKPWRDAAKAEQAAIRANADFLYQKALRDDPALASSK